MTNIELLEKKISDSGLKKAYLADQLGITLQCFLNKLSNKSEFKISEAMTLKRILRLNVKDFNAIFYAHDVEK